MPLEVSPHFSVSMEISYLHTSRSQQEEFGGKYCSANWRCQVSNNDRFMLSACLKMIRFTRRQNGGRIIMLLWWDIRNRNIRNRNKISTTCYHYTIYKEDLTANISGDYGQ